MFTRFCCSKQRCEIIDTDSGWHNFGPGCLNGQKWMCLFHVFRNVVSTQIYICPITAYQLITNKQYFILKLTHISAQCPRNHIVLAQDFPADFWVQRKTLVAVGCSFFFLSTFAQNSIIYCFFFPINFKIQYWFVMKMCILYRNH